MTPNKSFSEAVQWLIDNGRIQDQKALASVTGITETTLSRIINDKVRRPSAATVKKLMNAFPGVFKFRGSLIMIQKDLLQPTDDTNARAIPLPAGISPDDGAPAWAASLIDLVAQNTQSTENLLRDNLSLRSQISQLTEEVRGLRTAISKLLYQSSPSEPHITMAADNHIL